MAAYKPLIAVLLLILAAFPAGIAAKSAEERVVEWVTENEGQVHFTIGKECPTCVRGALAAKDLEEGELIAKLPLRLAVAFSPSTATDPPARAYELLERMHTDPDFNATYGPWWDSQPSPDAVFSPEMYSQEHLDLLQSSWLEQHTRGMQRLAADYFYGRRGKGVPLLDVVPASNVSLDTFNYVTALVVTRSFAFLFEKDGEHDLRAFMVPVLDILNHADPGQDNSKRENDHEFLYEYATKPIKKGEQITHPYHPGLTHRPDMSLAVYGFVQRRDPPLLAAQDLLGFAADNPFVDTRLTDEEYDPEGAEAIKAELERLEGIAAGLGTTLEQDEALLKAEEGDWKRRAILEWRVERKRALRHRAAHLQQRLASLAEL